MTIYRGALEYSMAKNVMFSHTDHKMAPWRVVKADNKKLARLNCIRLEKINGDIIAKF